MKRFSAIGVALFFAVAGVWMMAAQGTSQVPPVVIDRQEIAESYIKKTMQRVDRLEERVDAQNRQIEKLTKQVTDQASTIKGLEDRLKKAEASIKKLETKTN